MFEKAARLKLRFPWRGICSVEDLWDLPVKELDKLYIELNKEFKASQEESLLGTKTKEDKILALQIDIIKHIVEVRLQEADNAEKAKERKEQKQKLLHILAKKQDEELEGKSSEELQKMINDL